MKYVAVFSYTTDYGDANTNKFIIIKENTFINLTNQMIVSEVSLSKVYPNNYRSKENLQLLK